MRFFNNPGPGNITFVLTIAMVPVFLGLGCLFLFTDVWIEKVSSPNRIYVGLVLIGWGLFRGLTAYMRYKQTRREEEDDQTF